jgi:hypothetical protein
MTYNCPCCKSQLKAHLEGEKVILFCSNGPCECYAMNDGASGKNAKEAFDKLETIFEKWADSIP